MNDQQQIGYRNLIAEAQRLASCDALRLPSLAEYRSRAVPGGSFELHQIADWARYHEPPSGDDDQPAYLALAADCEALARWIEGRL